MSKHFKDRIISFLKHFFSDNYYYAVCFLYNWQGNRETVIPFLGYCSVVPAGVITLSIPIAPAGIGIGQAAFYNLFKWYGAQSGTFGATIITVYQLIQLMVNLSFVFVYLSNKRAIGRAVNLNAR